MSFDVSDEHHGVSMPFSGESVNLSKPNASVNPQEPSGQPSINDPNPSKAHAGTSTGPVENKPKKTVYSSFFPDRGTLIEVSEDGCPVQITRAYGVGVDTHKTFLCVTVIVNSQLQYIQFQHDFPTTSASILTAKEWALEIIGKYCNPPVADNEPFHYTIESTATMHYPVLKLWGGEPSVVNPVLAKAGRRKTDRIDSHVLASNDIMNYWPKTFVANDDINELRVLINERDYAGRLATQISNRISNTLFRFGYTIAREGSVTKNEKIRGIVEGIIAAEPYVPPGFHLTPIPEEARTMLREDYELFDQFEDRVEQYTHKIFKKVRSLNWETGEGLISGDEMIALLTTAPQIGELTAAIWLAQTVTPLRFYNAKALVAFCGLDPSVKTSAGKKTSDTKRGGNISLHKILCASGNRLLTFPSEEFGYWGDNKYKAGKSRSKVKNALARKLAVALYYMTLFNKPFSYKKYKLLQDMVLINIPLQDFAKLEPKFKRYLRILEPENIITTDDLIRAYMTCELDDIDGLGRNFFAIVKKLVNEQREYKAKWNELVGCPDDADEID